MKYVGIDEIHAAFDSGIDTITKDAFPYVKDDKIRFEKRNLRLRIEELIDQYLETLSGIIGSKPYTSGE